MKTLNALSLAAVASLSIAAGANAGQIYTSDVDFANGTISFDAIVADASSQLAVYSFDGGEKVALLGTVDLRQGLNSDVSVDYWDLNLEDVYVELNTNGALADTAIISSDAS